MALRLSLLTLVSALSLPSVWSLSAHVASRQLDSKILDIKKFVNTSEPIWTYFSTLETYLCKVDKKYNISEVSIFFKRSYMDSIKAKTELMEGKFDSNMPNMMLVSPAKGHEITTNETLVFASSDLSCGIFKVQLLSGSSVWYELRFKVPGTTEKPNEECLNSYYKMHAKTHHMYKK
uniref:Putative lipocalin-3 1 n=1 Tax=Amblyomma parvum TaxID=251391 RepID=A0A023G0Z8_AMBPA